MVRLVQNESRLFFFLFKFLNHSNTNLKTAILKFLETLPFPKALLANLKKEIGNIKNLEKQISKGQESAEESNLCLKKVPIILNRRFSFEDELQNLVPQNIFQENEEQFTFTQNNMFRFSLKEIFNKFNEINLYKLGVLKVVIIY